MFDVHLTRKGGKTVAVADIGSGSVALALLSVHSSGPATVLAAERVVLPAEERSKEATVAKLGEALAQTWKKITPSGSVPVAEVYCIIRAPWCHSVSAHAESHFESDTTITEDIISGLAKSALASAQGIDRDNIMEASVVRVELNGYPVGEPERKIARDIAVHALVSECDQALRGAVQNGLQGIFPHAKQLFRSSSRALLSLLRTRSGDQGDTVVVDVGSEATAILVAREGVADQQYVVREGMRAILQRVAPVGIPEETLALIRMIERDECSEPACEAIQSAMARAEPELVKVFGEGMAACAAVSRLPTRLLLLAHPDLAPWLSRFFARIDFTQFTQTTQPFAVDTLSLNDFQAYVVPEKGVALDTGLALSCALVNIEKTGA